MKINNQKLLPGQDILERKNYINKSGSGSGWKNGVFAFKNAEIKEVMKQIERWYDVEVKYEGQK